MCVEAAGEERRGGGSLAAGVFGGGSAATCVAGWTLRRRRSGRGFARRAVGARQHRRTRRSEAVLQSVARYPGRGCRIVDASLLDISPVVRRAAVETLAFGGAGPIWWSTAWRVGAECAAADGETDEAPKARMARVTQRRRGRPLDFLRVWRGICARRLLHFALALQALAGIFYFGAARRRYWPTALRLRRMAGIFELCWPRLRRGASVGRGAS